MSRIKPGKLYVISDGPRDSRPDDIEKVTASRDVFENLSWNCSVKRNYSVENLGCMERVSSGLDWVFSQESRAVILEDDCVPDESFFRFCETALQFYENIERVMSVSGTRFAPSTPGSPDIEFSRYAYCWGWATWANRWQKFHNELDQDAMGLKLSYLQRKLGGLRAAFYWKWLLGQVSSGKINSWAYKWTYTHWVCDGLSAIPSVNLISNIGAGKDATNTTTDSRWLGRPIGPLRFPLNCPNSVAAADDLDDWVEDHIFSKSLVERFRWIFRCVSRK
ncbi:hypothetical protein [Woeseia oceani]|uniref:hypothetical protein n=1 Tax=Woeseia oceani TaxID=1548547 RepID=UPI0009F54439|nr:hypothetical protein [Woeseia oceani]